MAPNTPEFKKNRLAEQLLSALFKLLTLVATSLFIFGIVETSSLEAAMIILKSGEKFESDNIWHEGQVVKFNLHGIAVGVPETDVATIIYKPATKQRADDTTTAKDDNNQTAAARSVAPLNKNNLSNQAGGRETSERVKKRQSGLAPPPGRNLSFLIDQLPFRGLKWGMRPASLGKLVRIKTENLYGGIVQYSLPEKTPQWPRVKLEGLMFGFWRNRLYSITMWVYGKPKYLRLRQEVFGRYGKLRAMKKKSEKYAWVGGHTDALLEFDPAINTGIFWMRSRLLDQQAKRLYPR